MQAVRLLALEKKTKWYQSYWFACLEMENFD